MGTGSATAAETVAFAQTALLAALALVLGYLETMVPLPFAPPGVRLGLSNVAVVIALFAVGRKCCCAVAAVKVSASALLFGSPVMFAYSAGGTALAVAGLLALYPFKSIGVVAASMTAAVLHNLGQVAVAAAMLGTAAVFLSFPPLMVAACITGALTGALARMLLPHARSAKAQWATLSPQVPPDGEEAAPMRAFLASLTPGALVGVGGANGSGKSTLLRHLPQLLPERRVALAFQNPDDQIVSPRLEDDVAFGPENEGMAPSEMRQWVPLCLEKAGLGAQGEALVHELSGGQRQQAVLAGMLALGPDVLAFDETTSMMDGEGKRRFRNCIDRCRAEGAAVVLATQSMEELFGCDEIALMADGAMAYFGMPSGASAEVLALSSLTEGEAR